MPECATVMKRLQALSFFMQPYDHGLYSGELPDRASHLRMITPYYEAAARADRANIVRHMSLA